MKNKFLLLLPLLLCACGGHFSILPDKKPTIRVEVPLPLQLKPVQYRQIELKEIEIGVKQKFFTLDEENFLKEEQNKEAIQARLNLYHNMIMEYQKYYGFETNQ